MQRCTPCSGGGGGGAPKPLLPLPLLPPLRGCCARRLCTNIKPAAAGGGRQSGLEQQRSCLAWHRRKCKPRRSTANPAQPPTPAVPAVAFIRQPRQQRRPLRVLAVGCKGVIPVAHELLKLGGLAAAAGGMGSGGWCEVCIQDDICCSVAHCECVGAHAPAPLTPAPPASCRRPSCACRCRRRHAWQRRRPHRRWPAGRIAAPQPRTRLPQAARLREGPRGGRCAALRRGLEPRGCRRQHKRASCCVCVVHCAITMAGARKAVNSCARARSARQSRS